MTPEQWSRHRVYDPTYDNPYPDEAPPRPPFPWVGLAIFGLWCLVAVAVAVYFAVGVS